MAVCLPRYLGSVESLPVGHWTMTHRGPAVRCSRCGGVDYLDIARVLPIGDTGSVIHACETTTCTTHGDVTVPLLTLESFES